MRKLETLAALAALLILTAWTTPAYAEPCEPGWAAGVFSLPGPDKGIAAAVTWDDGTGEALYLGGSFTFAGRESVNRIAKWDGSTWSALSDPGGNGLNSTVRALTVFDDGTGPALYAGGWFTTAGGVPANFIAKWDGSIWSALSGPSGNGIGAPGSWVSALMVFDDGTGPALYAGGNFTTAGGVVTNYIARWDGTAWSALEGPGGNGLSGRVNDLAVFDDGSGGGPALYVGGDFRRAGGVVVYSIAKWDGSAWSAVQGPNGSGVSGRVHTLTVFDDGMGPALYVGGNFWWAGGLAANDIAKWDGSTWSPLDGPGGNGTNNTVQALKGFDHGTGDGPVLYAGGQFTSAGGVMASSIARWDGSNWSTLEGSGGNGVSHPIYPDVQALAVFDDGTGEALFVGGGFTSAGGVIASHIAKWDGSNWSALEGSGGNALNSKVFAMTIFDDGPGGGPALYAGGWFTIAGGVAANRIAKWDGSSWFALSGPGGNGVSGNYGTRIGALTEFDDGFGSGPALYAGGEFTTAGGVTVDNIARWGGSDWSALEGPGGVGVNSGVEALTVFDDGTGGGPALYAGGAFDRAGGVTVNGIARWDGSIWSALEGPGGVGMNHWVFAMTVFDDGSGGGPALYAGGLFTTAGGVTVNRVAKWDGSDWSALEGPDGVGVNDGVDALTVFDDGSGPALFVGGSFTTAGGVEVNRVAKWDGNDWSAMAGPNGTGVDGEYSAWTTLQVDALTMFDDGTGPVLYAGGQFTFAGGFPSLYMAKWTACTPDPSCNAADLAEPYGLLDLADIVAFVTAFGAQDPAADLAEPFGVFDLADVVAFVVAFEAGCP